MAPRCAKYKLILYNSISQCETKLPARLAAWLNSLLTVIWQSWLLWVPQSENGSLDGWKLMRTYYIFF